MKNIDISYGEYFDVFCNGQNPLVPEEVFDRYIKKAKLFLNSKINGKEYIEYIDDVKSCLIAIAEELYAENKQGGIKSESTDGYSVAYSEKKDIEMRLCKVAMLYLEKSGLLYAGVE